MNFLNHAIKNRKKSTKNKYFFCDDSVLSAQTAADQSTTRPNAVPEIPKSPPKWPLRPGVLVHVKCDTKQSLCANRAQSPFNASSMNTSSLNNVSYASPLLAGAATSTRNTSVASGGGGVTNNNSTSTPITLPELPARNSTKSNNSNKKDTETVTDGVTTAKKAKSVARALLIDEDGITAKVESDDNSKEDENSNIDMNETALNDTTTTTTTGLLIENGAKISQSQLAATVPATVTLTSATTTSNGEPNNDELLRFTSSNLIERILGRLRWRREQSPNQNNAQNSNGNVGGGENGGGGSSANNNEDGILAKSNKRALSLLRATGWFGSGKSTNSTTGLMSDTNKSHLNGITCSDSGK